MGRNWAPLMLRPTQGPAPTALPGQPGWSLVSLCWWRCWRESPRSSAPQVLHLSGGATSPHPTPGCFSATSKRELKGTLTPPHPWSLGGEPPRGKTGADKASGEMQATAWAVGPGGGRSHGNRPPASAPALKRGSPDLKAHLQPQSALCREFLGVLAM